MNTPFNSIICGSRIFYTNIISRYSLQNKSIKRGSKFNKNGTYIAICLAYNCVFQYSVQCSKLNTIKLNNVSSFIHIHIFIRRSLYSCCQHFNTKSETICSVNNDLKHLVDFVKIATIQMPKSVLHINTYTEWNTSQKSYQRFYNNNI